MNTAVSTYTSAALLMKTLSRFGPTTEMIDIIRSSASPAIPPAENGSSNGNASVRGFRRSM
jgi:hypothetical protein